MANSKTIAWRQISVETFAIVVSILLAFSIDAWWDGRKDRQQEQEILLGLEIEFVDLRGRLDRWAQYNRTGMDYIERYLSDAVSDMHLEAIESTFAHASIANILDQGELLNGAGGFIFTSGGVAAKLKGQVRLNPDNILTNIW